MQQAIPYKSWIQINNTNTTRSRDSDKTSTSSNMKNLVSENAVIVIARQGCCMGHVVRRLLLGHGVNPAVYEVEDEDTTDELSEMVKIVGKEIELPSVFIGGELFGGLDKVMAAHITGQLVPVLKQAGALWL